MFSTLTLPNIDLAYGVSMANISETRRELERAAGSRLMAARGVALQTLKHLKDGRPLSGEPDKKRRVASKIRQIETMSEGAAQDVSMDGAESIKMGRSNLLPVSFLSLGLRVSRAVARINVPATGQIGSGFLCGPGLFITNSHVLPSAISAQTARVEFDFTAEDGIDPTIFGLDPSRCFVTSPVNDLDFSVVAIGSSFSGEKPVSSFGFCPLSGAGSKHAIGDFANIIQHPNGEEKQVAIQDNFIASRTDMTGTEQSVLHYFADTEPGSSGSPVFNNKWQVIALHHWGKAVRGLESNPGFKPESVNQGIRISRIVQQLGEQLPGLSPQSKELVSTLLERGRNLRSDRAAASLNAVSPPSIQTSPVHGASPLSSMATGASSPFVIPIELSISAASQGAQRQASSTHLPAQGAEASLPQTGEGYRPGFLDHNQVNLPRLRGRRANNVSLLLKPERYPTAKAGELQFTHFSIMMNKARRLPWFGACNVDGRLLFGINSDREIYRYPDQDVSIFSARDAEGGYGWRTDKRIAKAAQTPNSWYTGKNALVPRSGTDDAERYIAVADFDRGHMVRRTEPIWGENFAGQSANYQTFNVVNAAPQAPVYNQDKTRDPASINIGEEKRSWYGIEVAILRIATNEDRKFNVFTGPIFKEDDPIYASGKSGLPNCKVPLAFWKVAVWEDGKELKSLAMIASQKWSLRLNEGAESLSAPEDLFLLRDFLTKVSTLERKTGIDFGQNVRDADILKTVHASRLRRMTFAAFQNMLA